MILRTRFSLAALALAVASPLAAQNAAPTAPGPAAIVPLSAADSTRLTTLGHRYIGWLLSGLGDSLSAVMTPEALEASGGAVGLSEKMGQVAERAGMETALVAEKLTRRNGKPQFWHEGQFAGYDAEPLVFRLVLNIEGKVTGIGVGPKSQAPADQ